MTRDYPCIKKGFTKEEHDSPKNPVIFMPPPRDNEQNIPMTVTMEPNSNVAFFFETNSFDRLNRQFAPKIEIAEVKLP